MGYWAAHFFQAAGARVVAVGEHPFSVVNPKGIDIEDLQAYKAKKGSFDGYSKAKVVRAIRILLLFLIFEKGDQRKRCRVGGRVRHSDSRRS